MTAILLLACGTPTPSSEPSTPASPPAMDAAPAAGVRTGKVLEVTQGGGYTYAHVDACGEQVWAAGPQTELTVGSMVSMSSGMVMTNFESPSLHRTFDQLLFVESFRPAAGEPDCSASASVASPHPPLPAGASIVGTVAETMGGGGYTYVQLDVCGQKQWIAGPEVTVRVGDVVQVPEGFVMASFQSRSLQRTFDALRMVDAITPAAAPSCGD